MSKYKNFLIALTLFLIFYSCKINTNPIVLTGKFAIMPFSHDNSIFKEMPINHNCYINIDNKASKSFFYDKNEYFICSWLNKRNLLIGSTLYKNERPFGNQILLFDTDGNIVDSFQVKLEEIFLPNAISINDSKLLIKSWNRQNSSFASSNQNFVSINIMDLNTNQIIKRLENFSPSEYINFTEAAWSPCEYKFVYTQYFVLDYRHFDSIPIYNDKKYPKGVFIYNMLNDSIMQIDTSGRKANWSPDGKYIAYIKGTSIWLFDTKLNRIFELYKYSKKDYVIDIHWTPCSKYIYSHRRIKVNSMIYYFGGKENLIEISTKKSVPFINPQLSFKPYTWK